MRVASLALVSAAAAGLSLPPGASAITRSQAKATALQALKPQHFQFAVAVLGLPKPLKAGAVVVEAGPGPATKGQWKVVKHGLNQTLVMRTKPRVLRRKTWLFWEDLAPGAEFEHLSVLLLIDDKSGKVIRRQPESWYPLINGHRPAFLAQLTAYTSPRFLIYANPKLRPRTRVAHASRRPSSLSQAGLPKLPNDCIIVMGDDRDPQFVGDFVLAVKFAEELHLRKFDAENAEDLDAKITDIEKLHPPCKDILIMISGHGAPAVGSNITVSSGPGAGKPMFEKAVPQVWLAETKVGPFLTHHVIDGPDVRKILRRHPGTTFKLIVNSCFSGRWIYLRGVVPNLKVVATASRADQMSFGWGSASQKGSQKNGVVTYQPGSYLPDTTTNTTHASWFINGMFRALGKWAHSDKLQHQTGDDLAKAIEIAFPDSKENDLTAQLGWTNPQLGLGTGFAPEPHALWDIPGYNPPTLPKAGKSVGFDGSGSHYDYGHVEKWDWDFGDGKRDAAYGPLTYHTYAKPGVYNVTLKVTGDDGGTSSSSAQIYISGGGPKKATITDAPCSGYGGGYVDINIPSYAQDPTAALTTALAGCSGESIDPNSIVVTFVKGAVPPEDGGSTTDEWGNEKNHLHITFNFTGSSAATGPGSATFTASWK